ncbi:MAG: SIS domain-containing protein [Candidatus Lokiarchaeota archaeon]|nr:SIS domain-containing protein [Candidatus Lokiarchaeota archaeon]
MRVNNLKKYESTTLKEIFEEPESISNTLDQENTLQNITEVIQNLDPNLIIITGSGTSYNAGLASMYFLNKYVKIPTSVIHAAEFEYLIKPILKENQLLVCISQSGESGTTINACKIAKKRNIKTVALTAHPESSLGKLSTTCLPIKSGDEESVMATKTYVSQIAALFSLSISIGKSKRVIKNKKAAGLKRQLNEIPNKLQNMLPKLNKKSQLLSKYYKFVKAAFILGSGANYATAMEGALKLKEGSRILAQSYSTDEFRHGPITLADESVLIIGIIPQDPLKLKIFDKLFEIVKERHSSILGITSSSDISKRLDSYMKLPDIQEDFSPILNVVPLQLLANYIAIERGYDPDNPRFLTKIVYD